MSKEKQNVTMQSHHSYTRDFIEKSHNDFDSSINRVRGMSSSARKPLYFLQEQSTLDSDATYTSTSDRSQQKQESNLPKLNSRTTTPIDLTLDEKQKLVEQLINSLQKLKLDDSIISSLQQQNITFSK